MLARANYLLDAEAVKRLSHQAKHFFNHDQIKSLTQTINQLNEAAAGELTHQEIELLVKQVSAINSFLSFARLYVDFVTFNQFDVEHDIVDESLLTDIAKSAKQLTQTVAAIQSLVKVIGESRDLLSLMPSPTQVQARQSAQSKLDAIQRSRYHYLLQPIIAGLKIKNSELIKADKQIKKLKVHLYNEMTSIVSAGFIHSAMQLLLKQEAIAFDNDIFAQTIKGVEKIKKECAEWHRKNRDFSLYATGAFKFLAELNELIFARFQVDSELEGLVLTSAFAAGSLQLSQVTPHHAKCNDERVMMLYQLLNQESLTARLSLRIEQIIKRNKTTFFDAERVVLQLTGLDLDIKEYAELIADLSDELDDHDKAAALYRMGRELLAKIGLIHQDKIEALIMNLKLAMPDANTTDEAKHIQQLLSKLGAILVFSAPETVKKMHDDVIAARKMLKEKMPGVTINIRPAMYRFYSQSNLYSDAKDSPTSTDHPRIEKTPSESVGLSLAQGTHAKKK